MSDGSVMAVEYAGFGKQERMYIDGGLSRLKALLPSWLRARFPGFRPPGDSAWGMASISHGVGDALYVYISRRGPGKGNRNPDAYSFAQVVDEDGCVFCSVRSGGYDGGGVDSRARRALRQRTGGSTGPLPFWSAGPNSIQWFRFEAFPRRQKKFRLLVYDDSDPASYAEFLIANPAFPFQSTNWLAQPMPIARTQDHVSFILTNLTIIDASPLGRPRGVKHIAADFEVTEDGRASTNWQALQGDLSDSSGNFMTGRSAGAGALCPREPAWKMRVKFFGSEKSSKAPNEVWSLKGLPVPAPGKFNLLDRRVPLQGARLWLRAFGGSGDFTFKNNLQATGAAFTYTNNLQVTGAPSNGRMGNSYSEIGNTVFHLPRSYQVHADTPYLAIPYFAGLDGNHRLTVRAVDDQGREFYGHNFRPKPSQAMSASKRDNADYLDNSEPGDFSFGQTFVAFDLPPDAKTVDLYFCVHKCQIVEFTFKPPAANLSLNK